MELKRVVVTGLGAVTPLGNDVPTTWNALLNGESGAGPITHFDASEFKTQFACEVKNFDPTAYFSVKEARKLDLYAQYAVASAKEGMDDSGLDLEKVNKDRAGVIFAAGIGGISTFRADIDVSTCGEISPLKALNYLIHSFDTDIMTIDYRVRGFTRDITGHKLFIDHNITSIQDYIPELVKEHYQMIDVNVYQENIFHTKCKLKDFDLDNYLFGLSKEQLHPGEVKRIEAKLRHEMDEIFYGKNMDRINL